MGQNGSRSYQIQLCHFVLTSLLQDALLYHGASALSSPSPRCGGGKCSRQASAADGSAKKHEKTVSDRRRMASRLGKKRAFPLRRLRATQPAGPKNGSTPRCAVGNIKGGGNESPCVLPALGGRGGFPQASC